MTTSNPIQILLNENKTNKKLIDINIIKSPMKYEILELLRHEEMSFEDIVLNTSKSKASVSMHLKSLREEGIVNYKPNPHDNRKKIFYLNSEFLGSVETNENNPKNQTEKLIEDFIEKGDVEYTLMLVQTLKSILKEYGFKIDPVLKSIGKHIGQYLSSKLKDENLDNFITNITQYWEENNLGKLSFKIAQNIQITCKECFECLNTPKTGKPSCDIVCGMLESLFENYFNFKLNVVEIKCYSMGDEECVFEIEP